MRERALSLGPQPGCPVRPLGSRALGISWSWGLGPERGGSESTSAPAACLPWATLTPVCETRWLFSGFCFLVFTTNVSFSLYK